MMYPKFKADIENIEENTEALFSALEKMELELHQEWMEFFARRKTEPGLILHRYPFHAILEMKKDATKINRNIKDFMEKLFLECSSSNRTVSRITKPKPKRSYVRRKNFTTNSLPSPGFGSTAKPNFETSLFSIDESVETNINNTSLDFGNDQNGVQQISIEPDWANNDLFGEINEMYLSSEKMPSILSDENSYIEEKQCYFNPSDILEIAINETINNSNVEKVHT